MTTATEDEIRFFRDILELRFVRDISSECARALIDKLDAHRSAVSACVASPMPEAQRTVDEHSEDISRARHHGWICEFCYREDASARLPDKWDFVWQSAVCPECRVRVHADGGYAVVKGGAYAKRPDPRDVPVASGIAAAPAPVTTAQINELIAALTDMCKEDLAYANTANDRALAIAQCLAATLAAKDADRFRLVKMVDDAAAAQRIAEKRVRKLEDHIAQLVETTNAYEELDIIRARAATKGTDNG